MRSPFRHAFFPARRLEALRAQEIDGFDGHDTVGSPTVRDDLPLLGQLGEPPLELRQRDRDRPRDVPGAVLLARPHVEHGHLAAAHAAQQLGAAHRLHGLAPREVLATHLLDLGEARLGQPPQSEKELADLLVRQPVLDVEALLLRFDQARPAQDLQVLRGVGEADVRLRRQRLDRARPLAEQIEELEPFRGRQGPAEASKLLVDVVLEAPLRSGHALTQVFK